MKRLLYILAFIYLNAFSQTDITVHGKYLEVFNGEDLVIGCYIDSARVESPFNINAYSTLDSLSEISYPDYPITGTWVEKDDMYNYEGDVVRVTQSHYITVYSPCDLPALFSFYRENTDDLEWIENEQVLVGWIRLYNEIAYECIQDHMTLSSWTPDISVSLWSIVQSGCPDWVQPTGGHDAYNIGDCVTFEGDEYISLINANVWSPSVYPAGWEIQ